jgi:hypothetical protein
MLRRRPARLPEISGQAADAAAEAPEKPPLREPAVAG